MPAVLVGQQERWPLCVSIPAITPLQECEQNGVKIEPFSRETVFEPVLVSRIWLGSNDALGLQTV